MITSILNDCLLLRNQPVDKLQGYFSSINLHIFDDIIDKYKEEATQIVLYILCAYDEQSPLVIARQDSKAEQDGICEYLNIPEFKRKNLIELKDSCVRVAVTQYVEQFAGEIYRSLMFMKIQLQDYQLAITNKQYYTQKEDKDSSAAGEAKEVVFLFDWKQQGKAQQQCNILAKQVESLEKQIKEKVKQMDGIEDLKKYSREGIETGRLKVTRTGNIEGIIK